MNKAGHGSPGRRGVAALVAVVGLASFLVGSVGVPTEIAPPSGDPAAPDAILQAGFVEFLFSPFVYGVVAVAVVAAAVLLVLRHSPASGGMLLGVGIPLAAALGDVYTSWAHPDLSPTAAGWSLAAGPALIAMAGGVAFRQGPRGAALPAWGLLGAAALAVAPFLSATTNRAGRDLPPNGLAIDVAEAALVVAIVIAHLFPTAPRRFLTGALLGIGLLNVAFAIQGLASWGPSPAFAVGPATYLRVGGGLILVAASAATVERLGLTPGRRG